MLKDRMRKARKDAGLTQARLGRLVGENVFWISHRETGKVEWSFEDVERVSEALALTDEDWIDLRGSSVA